MQGIFTYTEISNLCLVTPLLSLDATAHGPVEVVFSVVFFSFNLSNLTKGFKSLIEKEIFHLS